MTPVHFKEAQTPFGPPEDLDESQVRTIHAYRGVVDRGSLEGSVIVVTAWIPSAEELAELNAGNPVYLSFIGGLPPHMATTSFQQATSIA